MIYHYTKGFKLPSILAHGLKPSDILLTPGESPVLWFTTNPTWEITVFGSDARSLEEAHKFVTDNTAKINGATVPVGPLVRIVCDDAVAPYTWKEIREVASIPAKMAQHLYDLAIEVGSRPGEWRATLDVISAERFLAIEQYDGARWLPMNGGDR